MKRLNNQYSLVRILHSVPGKQAVDIYLNGKIFFKGLVFGNFTPYIYVPKKQYILEIFKTNTVEIPIVSQVFDIDSDGFVTIAMVGRDTNISTLTIPEEQEVPNGDFSKFRFINLIPRFPNFDVVANGQIIISDIDYKEIPDYVTVKSGTYSFRLVSSYSDQMESYQDQLIIKSRVTLEPQKVYTLYLIGDSPVIAILQSIDGSAFLVY